MSEDYLDRPECGRCGVDPGDHYDNRCPDGGVYSPLPGLLKRRLMETETRLAEARAHGYRLQRILDDHVALAVAADRAVRRAREDDRSNIGKAFKRFVERL